MGTPEIILLITAVVFIGISFFLVDRVKGVSSSSKQEEGERVTTLSEEEKKQIKLQVQAIIDRELNNQLITIEEKLNQLSNEKIMAVNEFSSQVLEKIEVNNSEVVFLYQMLKEKEEELKTTFTKMETVRRDVRDLLDKLSKLLANRNKVQSTGAKSSDFTESTEEKLKALEEAETMEFVHKESGEEISEKADTSALVAQHKEDIIRLYQQQCSVLEISKTLGLGQGEVKLVLDLYGN